MSDKANKKETKQKTYKLGDVVEYLGKKYKIVDVLENGDYHLKNTEAPFDSFLTVLPKDTDDNNS